MKYMRAKVKAVNTPPHNSSREETLSQILSNLKELTDWKDLQSKVNRNFII